MATINPNYLTLAQNYLATKERTPHYEVRYTDDASVLPAEGWCNLKSFSEEEIAQLLALREKYGKAEFFNHLDEIFDEEALYDIAPGDIFYIDLDSKYYMYSFTCHQLTDDGVKTRSVEINLTDETYVKLLALHLKDNGLNINKLKYADKELFEIVTRGVDCHFCDDLAYIALYPYVITMDEIQADAQKVREQHPAMFDDKCFLVGYTM